MFKGLNDTPVVSQFDNAIHGNMVDGDSPYNVRNNDVVRSFSPIMSSTGPAGYPGNNQLQKMIGSVSQINDLANIAQMAGGTQNSAFGFAGGNNEDFITDQAVNNIKSFPAGFY